MSANAIWFDKSQSLYFFDGQSVTQSKVGRLIAAALVNGEQFVDFNYCCVTVNYLIEMLRFTGKNGWFYDVLDHTQDHRFNPNSPTPGGYWGEAQSLSEQARALLLQAAEVRKLARSVDGNEALIGGARQLESEARHLQKAAYATLHGAHAKSAACRKR